MKMAFERERGKFRTFLSYRSGGVVRVADTAGAAINARNDRGLSPLDYAIREGHEAIASRLRAVGAFRSP